MRIPEGRELPKGLDAGPMSVPGFCGLRTGPAAEQKKARTERPGAGGG